MTSQPRSNDPPQGAAPAPEATAKGCACTAPSPNCQHLHCRLGHELRPVDAGRIDPRNATVSEIFAFLDLADHDEVVAEQRERLRERAQHERQQELAKAFIRTQKRRGRQRQIPVRW
ncbi:MAG: hypothetical protein FJ312_10605 [SAR202 cluster bacterium]|nr:hypothetical protein [SAR202 cluster bacterium]